MAKISHININHSKAVQDLIARVYEEKSLKFVTLSEPYSIPSDRR